MDLFSALQAQQQGNQQGQAASQGLIPSASQPKGSPQLCAKAIQLLRKEVANLNAIQDQLFREAGTDDAMHKAIKEVMGCTHKLQGVTTGLEAHQQELTQAQTSQQAAY